MNPRDRTTNVTARTDIAYVKISHEHRFGAMDSTPTEIELTSAEALLVGRELIAAAIKRELPTKNATVAVDVRISIDLPQ